MSGNNLNVSIGRVGYLAADRISTCSESRQPKERLTSLTT